MKRRYLFPVLIVMLTIVISSRQTVMAGSGSVPVSPGTALIRGTVKFTGAVPPAKPISMLADPSCSKQHAAPVLAREIIADSKGGLQNVVVFIADGLGDRTFEVPKEPAVISQKGCMYQPHVLAMRANQTLEVVNRDPTSHNIHPTPANNREGNKAELPGAE